MKKNVILCAMLILALSFAGLGLEEYTLSSEMQVELEYRGHFSIESDSDSPKLSSVTTKVQMIPKDGFGQEVGDMRTRGSFSSDGNYLLFNWNTHALGDYDLGYSVPLTLRPYSLLIDSKIPFPIDAQKTAGYSKYLQPTATIDSDSPAIRAKALELAQGEDDLYSVTIKVADYVQRTVVYDLNTLTEKASQKASWVLENKQGVCDEMTSLFIAMMRSLGVPTRFVSGISYTTSPLFSDPWQPHGWAEVYFPDKGWVPVDIAFGQFGYVDASHIRLYEGTDPTDDVIYYEWTGQDISLKESPSEFRVTVKKVGYAIEDTVLLRVSPLASKVDLGSYNRIEVVATNMGKGYAVRTLQLGLPREVELIGSKTKSVLIKPNTEAKVIFIVKVPEELDPAYTYTFPITVVSERNTTARSLFLAQKGLTQFSYKEVGESRELMNSKQFLIVCKAPPKTRIGALASTSCSFERLFGSGQVEMCIDRICEENTLRVGEKYEMEVNLETTTAGFRTVLASVKSDVKEYATIDYTVYDEPAVSFQVESPASARLGEDIVLGVLVAKVSVSEPQKLVVKISSGNFEQRWNVSSLSNSEHLKVTLQDFPLTSSTSFKIDLFWMDEQGRGYTNSSTVEVVGYADGFWDSVRLFINKLL